MYLSEHLRKPRPDDDMRALIGEILDIDTVPDKTRDFISSLSASYTTYGRLTPKQMGALIRTCEQWVEGAG
jgi:hypothetical protein